MAATCFSAGWTYPISVSPLLDGGVPTGGFPVCILLHGNGGSGAPLKCWNQFRSILPDSKLVRRQLGTWNSWNICAEASDAPDWRCLETWLDRLAT